MKPNRLSRIWIEISMGFLLMLIPVVLLGFVSQQLVSNALHGQIMSASETAVHQMSKGIYEIVKATQESYKQISVNESFQDLMTTDFETISEYQSLKKRREIDALLRNHSSASSDISRIIFNLNNEQLYIPHLEMQLLTEEKQNEIVGGDWYDQVLEKNGQLLWIGRHSEIDDMFDERRWDYAMSAVGKVRSYPVEKSSGIMIFDVRVSSIREIFDGVDLGRGSEVHLISPDDRDIMMMSDTGAFVFDVFNKMQVNDVVETYYESDETIQSFYTDYNGISYLAVVEAVGDTGFLVVGLMPETTITEPAKRIAQWTGVIVLVAGIIVVFIGAYVIPKNISRRIHVLIRKMVRVENGDLTIEETIDSNDEIGMIDRYFNRMVERLDLVIKENYINQLDKREAELNALQLQINPHFLYNTLEIISSMAAVEGCDEIGMVSEHLGDMFRYSVRQEDGYYVGIEEELTHIRNYLSIHQVRLGDRLEVYYDIDRSVTGLKVIKFILQPIVENAIGHGLKDQHGMIEVAARVEDDDLIIEISDSGTGMDKETQDVLQTSLREKGDSFRGEGRIGLRNVNARIRMLCGEAYGMSIVSEPEEGTSVVFRLPVVREKGGSIDGEAI